jgi:hypothetical protein
MNNSPKTVTITDPRKTIFKVSGATLVVLLAMVFVGVQWGKLLLDTEFMTDAAYAAEKAQMFVAVAEHEQNFDERITELTAVQANQGQMLEHHIEDFGRMVKSIALADAVDLYNNADEALYTHLRYEAKDGATSSSAARRRELERRKIAAKEYRDCVLGEEPNCEALRPR